MLIILGQLCKAKNFIWLKYFPWVESGIKAWVSLKNRLISRKKIIFRKFWNNLHINYICDKSWIKYLIWVFKIIEHLKTLEWNFPFVWSCLKAVYQKFLFTKNVCSLSLICIVLIMVKHCSALGQRASVLLYVLLGRMKKSLSFLKNVYKE